MKKTVILHPRAQFNLLKSETASFEKLRGQIRRLIARLMGRK